MKNKIFQITTSFLIIIVLTIMPFFNIPKAKATSLSSVIGGLSSLVTELPGCTSVLGGGVSDLFSGIKKLFKGKTGSKVNSYTNLNGLVEKVENLVVKNDSVPTFDENANTKIDKLSQQVDMLQGTTDKVETATTSVNKNQTCLDSIGKAVVKKLKDELTVGVVNWIQTGNFGDSFFIKDTSKFFADIEKEEILTFGEELKNEVLYPYAKDYVAYLSNSYNNQSFAQIAQSSLGEITGNVGNMTTGYINSAGEWVTNEVSGLVGSITNQDNINGWISGQVNNAGALGTNYVSQYTETALEKAVNAGAGWAGFDAVAQNPANNPFGFSLLASSELQARTATKTTQKKDELMQSGGFLGDEKCTDPAGVTKEEHQAALSERSSSSIGPYQYDLCKKWEYVTPGKTIADELTHALSLKDSSLISADTLNDAIAALLDSALAMLITSLTNDGLTEISENDISRNYDIGNYDGGGIAQYQTDQINTDYSAYQRDSSPWLQNHPDFDIRRDLNQALIDEQRIYVQKLKEQNEILPELLKTIYQLD
ncbi:MAG: hypothetical protein ABH951_02805, partial [Patescibacteria group bacterium]